MQDLCQQHCAWCVGCLIGLLLLVCSCCLLFVGCCLLIVIVCCCCCVGSCLFVAVLGGVCLLCRLPLFLFFLFSSSFFFVFFLLLAWQTFIFLFFKFQMTSHQIHTHTPPTQARWTRPSSTGRRPSKPLPTARTRPWEASLATSRTLCPPRCSWRARAGG